MTISVKKDLEKFYTEQFAHKMKYDWSVSIPDNETDFPDLIINNNGLVFGLEVRALNKSERRRGGSYEKEKENYNQRMITKLTQSYYQQTNRPIKVDIFGKLNDEIVGRILNILLKNPIEDYQTFSHAIESSSGNISIYITGLPNNFQNYSYWRSINNSIGFEKIIKTEDIETIIKIKSRNIKKYTKYYEDVSLLLYCNQLFNSGMINLKNIFIVNKYGFKNVYLYEHPTYASSF